MQKRKWVYLSPPQAFEITCDLCGGNNITWSEFRRRIWCYDCLKDTFGNPGVLDGPFPMNRHLHEMLGFSVDRIHIPSGRVMRWHIRENGRRIIWKLARPKTKEERPKNE